MLLLLWPQPDEDTIRRAMAKAIAAGTLLSHQVGVDQAKQDLLYFAGILGVSIPLKAAPPNLREVRRRANTAGRNYAEAWIARFEEKKEEAFWGINATATETTAAEAYRVDRIAATEAAMEVNEARRETVIGSLEDAGVDLRMFVRVWCAKLDLKACSFCAGSHGMVAPLNGEYPNGEEPGEVHPYCRCGEYIVLVH